MRCATRPMTSVLAVSVLLALAGSARGQNALGDGRALDRNLQNKTGGAIPRRADPTLESIKFNNAVMGGTATGGKAFRGNAGFLASDQFAGRLGSDDLYSFKREAMPADNPALGVRGTDALRYQFGATTGAEVPFYMVHGPGTLSRSATLPTSGTPNALRSTSEFLAARAARPSLVGVRQDEWGAEYVAKASPLLGVSWTKTRASPLEAAARTDLTAPLGQQTPQAAPPGSGTAPSPLSGLESAGPGVASALDRPSTVNTAQRPTPTNQVVTRVMNDLRAEMTLPRIAPVDPTRPPDNANPIATGANPTPAPNVVPGSATTPGTSAPGTKPATPEPQTLELQLEKLRASMRGEIPPKTMKEVEKKREADKLKQAPGTNAPGAGEATPPAGAKPESKGLNVPPPQVIAPEGLTPEMIRGLRKSGEKRVDSLVEPAPTPAAGATTDPNSAIRDMDAYQAMMTSGQTWLAKGRFFDAEDRFTRAIAALPGDPMARAGRINAQLGAGLFLSAAANLRTLLADHPELVATRYADNLMPSADRSGKITAQLRLELNAPGSALQRDAALLMAYLGYQRDDEAQVADGLAEFAKRIDPDNAKDQALLALIIAAWGPKAP